MTGIEERANRPDAERNRDRPIDRPLGPEQGLPLDQSLRGRREEFRQQLEQNRSSLVEEAYQLTARLNELSQQLEPIRAPGEQAISAMQEFKKLDMPYDRDGVGPAVVVDNNLISPTDGIRAFSLGDGEKQMGFTATPGIGCCQAAFRSWQVAQHNTFEGQSFENHPKMYKAWKLWNDWPKAYPGIDTRDFRGPVEAITWLGIGVEVPQGEIQRGDVMQTWEKKTWVDKKSGWAGHVGYVTDVQRNGAGDIHEMTVLSATNYQGSDQAIKPRTWHKNRIDKFFNGDDKRAIYFGRIYGGGESLERMVHRDRELTTAIREGTRQLDTINRVLATYDSRIALTAQILENRIPSGLSSSVAQRIRTAQSLMDRATSDVERERVVAYANKLPEVIPDDQIRDRVANIVQQELGQYRTNRNRATDERRVLRDLEQRELALKELDQTVARFDKRQIELDADRRFSNLEERIQVETHLEQLLFVRATAKQMIDAARNLELRASIEAIGRRLVEAGKLEGVDVIRDFLNRLQRGMFEEQRDLENRFQLLKGEVEERWKLEDE